MRAPFEATIDTCRGVNLQPGDRALDLHYVRSAQNCRHEAGKMLVKRTGSWKLNAASVGTGVVVGGLFDWLGAVPGQILVVSDNGHLYTATHGSGTRTFTDRGALGASANQAAFASFYQGGTNKVFIASEQAAGLASWDGGTLVTGIASTPASAIGLRTYLDRLFCVNRSRRLYYSAIADGTAFSVASGGGFADLGIGGDDKLVGLARVGSSLLLFTADACARFAGSGPSNINLATDTEGVSNAYGCIAPRTILELQDAEGVGDAVFCLTRSGPALFTEGGMTPLWEPLLSEWRGLDMNLTGTLGVAVHHRGRQEVWVAVTQGGGSVNARIWCWHYPTNSWWGPWVRGTVNQWATLAPFVYDNVGDAYEGEDFVLSAVGSDIYVEDYRKAGSNRQDQATAADGTGGTAISVSVGLAPLTGPTVRDELVVRQLEALVATNGGTSLGYAWTAQDRSQAGSGSGSISYGSSPTPYARRARTAARGRRVAFTLTDTSAYNMELHGLSFTGYRARRR